MSHDYVYPHRIIRNHKTFKKYENYLEKNFSRYCLIRSYKGGSYTLYFTDKEKPGFLFTLSISASSINKRLSPKKLFNKLRVNSIPLSSITEEDLELYYWRYSNPVKGFIRASKLSGA
jgi:hypothetical protein